MSDEFVTAKDGEVSDCDSLGSTIVMDVSRDDDSSSPELVIDENVSPDGWLS
jgi:hypothetical protein